MFDFQQKKKYSVKPLSCGDRWVGRLADQKVPLLFPDHDNLVNKHAIILINEYDPDREQ